MFNKVVSTHISLSSPAGLALHQALLDRLCSVRVLGEGTAHSCTLHSARALGALRSLGSTQSYSRTCTSCACRFSLWTHRKFCLTLACWQTLSFRADRAQVMGLNSLWTEIGIIKQRSLLLCLLSLVWFIFQMYAYFQEASWKFIFIVEMECFLAFCESVGVHSCPRSSWCQQLPTKTIQRLEQLWLPIQSR